MTSNENDDSNAYKIACKKATQMRVRMNESYNINNGNNKGKRQRKVVFFIYTWVFV